MSDKQWESEDLMKNTPILSGLKVLVSPAMQLPVFEDTLRNRSSGTRAGASSRSDLSGAMVMLRSY